MTKTLTKAEEQVMHVLWEIKQGFTKDVVAQLPEPKPHYNTVSTIIKILTDKGFVEVLPMGKSHLYKPLIAREDYSKQSVKKIVKGYFNGSFSNMLSFFAREKDISISELEAVLKEMKKKK